MSSQYYKITRRLGTPHVNSVTVTVPLVGPQGPAGPQGEQGPPGEVSGSLAWDNVTDKPTTFPPSAHTHQASEIVDFTSAVEAVSPPADWDTLANKPSTFPPSSHGHVAADVSDFTTAAAAAAPVQSVAGKTGTVTLAKADVGLGNVDNTSDTNKPISSATQSALDGKAALSHTHTASQVTDFNTAAAAAAPVQSVNGNTGTVTVAVPSASTATPQALGTAAAGTSADFARADHVHAMPSASDVGAAAASHTHDAAAITSGTLDNARVNFAAPPAIGNTTPAAGSFTTLNASGETELVNGTNAAGPLRIYNTFTSATNHERGFLRWSSNVFQIGTEKGSAGGTARALDLQVDGTTRFSVATTGRITINPNDGSTGDGVTITSSRTAGNASLLRLVDGGITCTGGQNRFIFGSSAGTSASNILNNFNNALCLLLRRAGTGTGDFLDLQDSSNVSKLLIDRDANFVLPTSGGVKIGTGTTQLLGFWNATPAAQPAAVADATDAASTQDRLNDLLARLRTLGLIAT
jgi:hypothetical protein